MHLRKNSFNSDILGTEDPRHFSDWKFRNLHQPVNLGNQNLLSKLIERRRRAILKPRGIKAFLHAILNR